MECCSILHVQRRRTAPSRSYDAVGVPRISVRIEHRFYVYRENPSAIRSAFESRARIRLSCNDRIRTLQRRIRLLCRCRHRRTVLLLYVYTCVVVSCRRHIISIALYSAVNMRVYVNYAERPTDKKVLSSTKYKYLIAYIHSTSCSRDATQIRGGVTENMAICLRRVVYKC